MSSEHTRLQDGEGEHIEADANNTWEADTYSLSSTVTEFMYENGRRYHGYHEGTYWGPNDDKQNEQLELLHVIFLMKLEKLHHVTLNNPKNILDIGTGTGIWAIEMAELYPNTEIIGTDLSPIQPQWVPPNIRFEIDDAENEWLYDPDEFDFIHIRMLFGSIRNWPKLFRQAYKHTKPGGWIESTELYLPYCSDDGTLLPDSEVMKWCNMLKEAADALGRTLDVPENLERWIRDAGYENVHSEIIKMPVGSWPLDKKLKEIGMINLKMLLDGLEGFTLALFTRGLGWKPDEVQVLLAALRKEFVDPNIHIYFKYQVVYAQKPMAITSPQSPPSSGASTPTRRDVTSISSLLSND